MKRNQILRLIAPPVLTLVLAALALPVMAQQQTAAERAAALKATLEASRVVLKHYEWIETTVVSVKGEEKSRKQERCYYGADGGLQKVEISETQDTQQPRGFFRRRIAERKKEELTDYMKNAIALVKSYVPPSPAQIQIAKDAGKVSIDVVDPGKRARLNFRDYQKPGDNLAADIDLTNNRLLGVKVSTYLDDPSDTITLNVRTGRLNDGTTYPAAVTLNAPDKKLTVSVQYGGYRKIN